MSTARLPQIVLHRAILPAIHRLSQVDSPLLKGLHPVLPAIHLTLRKGLHRRLATPRVHRSYYRQGGFNSLYAR